jgi:hypothetical protein
MILHTLQNIYPWFETVTLRSLPPKDPNDDEEKNEEEEENDEEQEEEPAVIREPDE